MTDKQLREYVKGHYYADVEEGLLWEPFENYPEEQIEEWVENDVDGLRRLIPEPSVNLEELTINSLFKVRDAYDMLMTYGRPVMDADVQAVQAEIEKCAKKIII